MGYTSSDKDLYEKIREEAPKIIEVWKKIKEKKGIDRLLMEFDDLKHDYEYRVEDTRSEILRNVSEAAGAYEILVKELEKWSGCKSFSTNDPEALYQCIGKYFFMEGIIDGIRKYTELYGDLLPKLGKLEEFINDLKTLANYKVIGDLHKRYQEVKEQKLRDLSEIASTYNHPVSQEDLIIRSYELASQFVADLIFRYLKSPKDLKNSL